MTAQDLLDRTLHIDLPVIEDRLTGEIKGTFGQHYPRMSSYRLA